MGQDLTVEFFDGLGQDFGFEDAALLKNGTLARGEIVSITPTGVYRGGQADQSAQAAVCDVTLEVVPLDGSARYRATVRHLVPGISLPRLQEPGAPVAVRVDPADKNRIELDLTADPPDAPASTEDPNLAVLTNNDGAPRSAQPAPTTGDLLAKGTPCTVELKLVYPIGQDDSTGHPLSGLLMTVHHDDDDFTAQVGVFIPDDKAAKVVVGATLPARWMRAGSDDIVVPDWGKI